jgi:tRNA(fMet)-specific endonuclease VapC
MMALIRTAEWIGISIITQIEFLCIRGLSSDDRSAFQAFVDRVEVVPLTSGPSALLDQIIAVRMAFNLKVPDAIIAASALAANAELVSGDADFDKVKGLRRVAP